MTLQSNQLPSPNIAPATKSDSPTSQYALTSPNTAPATEALCSALLLLCFTLLSLSLKVRKLGSFSTQLPLISTYINTFSHSGGLCVCILVYMITYVHTSTRLQMSALKPKK